MSFDGLTFLSTAGAEPASLPLALLLVFGSAKLLAEVFERFNQPGMVGEILAGVLIGPSVFGLFTMAGDPDALELYQSAGFRPVPLATTDMLPALQTGLIEAFDVPPLLAMLNQWFGVANHMIDLKWAPLVGATIVSKQAWERTPEQARPQMYEAARKSGNRLRGEIRKMGDDAVTEMQKRGLRITSPDAGTLAEWRREVEAAYPKLRGRLVPAELFDEAKRLRDEFRSGGGAKP